MCATLNLFLTSIQKFLAIKEMWVKTLLVHLQLIWFLPYNSTTTLTDGSQKYLTLQILSNPQYSANQIEPAM